MIIGSGDRRARAPIPKIWRIFGVYESFFPKVEVTQELCEAVQGDPPQVSFVCVGPERWDVKERADGCIDVLSINAHYNTNPKILIVFLAMDKGFETVETVLRQKKKSGLCQLRKQLWLGRACN